MLLLLSLLLMARVAGAAALPGLRVETVAAAIPGFVSSIVTDSAGRVYCTTTDGWIHRVAADGTAVQVASLPTRAGSNSGLLGMALADDATAVVHYTVWSPTREDKILADIVSLVDLATGVETVLHRFVCDLEDPDDGVSSEHHGGNPVVAPDGSVFVGIGEFGGYTIAQKPEWIGGKLWRIDRAGNATQWALGLRNPFDLAFDPERGALARADNGPTAGDEIDVVRAGDNLGWPLTVGSEPPRPGTVPPVYVFPQTVAPTGLHRLRGSNPTLRSGVLVAAFVTRALYYFPSVAEPRTAAPYPLIESFDRFIIDVTETPAGEVLFASAWGASSAIHRLVPPPHGDCDGDGALDWRDVVALVGEINDGEVSGHSTFTAHEGAIASSWGCDANSDGRIDSTDLEALMSMLQRRRRGVR